MPNSYEKWREGWDRQMAHLQREKHLMDDPWLSHFTYPAYVVSKSDPPVYVWDVDTLPEAVELLRQLGPVHDVECWTRGCITAQPVHLIDKQYLQGTFHWTVAACYVLQHHVGGGFASHSIKGWLTERPVIVSVHIQHLEPRWCPRGKYHPRKMRRTMELQSEAIPVVAAAARKLVWGEKGEESFRLHYYFQGLEALGHCVATEQEQ